MSDVEHTLKELSPHMGGEKLATGPAIGAVALTLAMKYCDITTVQDGALYQQYKIEGRNMVPLDLAMVFDVAIQIEKHLMGTSERISALVVDALKVIVDEEDEEGEQS